jgi:enoyl-CoA hydratase/carnithine racemase
MVRDDHLREAIYTAREFAAVEAERLGFVTRLADDPLAEALALARTIAGRSPAAICAAKRLAGAEGDAATLLMAETEEQQRLLGKPEQIEQVRANMEKRPARF